MKSQNFMLRLFRLLLNAVQRFARACVKVFKRAKRNVSRPVNVMRVVATGVYSLVTPIVRPAGLALALTVFAFTGLYAQSLDTSSAEALINSAPYVFGVMVTIGGYLSAYIPFFNKIESGTYRVLALAVVMLIGFIMFGFGEVIPLALAYAASTSLYEVFFSLFAKSAKPTEDNNG